MLGSGRQAVDSDGAGTGAGQGRTAGGRGARRSARAATALAAALALCTALAGPADAATVSPPLASGLVGPLGLAVTPGGTAYVAETFTNTLTKVGTAGRKTTLLEGAEGISGVSVGADGGIAYTWSIQPEKGKQVGQLRRLAPDGTTSVLGRIGAYEFGQNPDHVNSYGFQGLTEACAAQVPAEIGGEPYPGYRDTHPYAVTQLADGSYAVADAGVNAVVRVGPGGRVSTIAVLPPVPLTVTAGIAAGLGLPACTVSKAYNFEPVPTDVEVGPDGMLYVSSLAGGPEDGSVGALGGVFRVDPANGKVTRIASGFAGATGLAVGPQGRVYVAELYANRISYVNASGRPTPLAEVGAPAALELSRTALYATVDVLPPGNGKLVRIRLSAGQG